MSDVLNGNVLVVNRNFQPVHVIGVRDAMRLLCGDKAQVVTEDYGCYDSEEWARMSMNANENIIRTVSRQFVVPEVIRLLEFDRRVRYTINYTRENIFYRDGYRCQYCNALLTRKEATIDHVIPRARQDDFGMTPKEISAWDNVVTSCSKCNAKKGCKTPKEANMHLSSRPSRPDYVGQVRGLHERNIRPSWKVYLESLKGKVR